MPSHDITICNGDKCTLRAFCHRHTVYRQSSQAQRLHISQTNPQDCIDNNKNLFWKEI